MTKRKKESNVDRRAKDGGALFSEHRFLIYILAVATALRVWNITWQLPQLYEEAIPLRFGMKLWDLGNQPIDHHFFVYPAFSYYVQFVLQALHFLVGLITGTYQQLTTFLNAFETDPTMFGIIGRAGTILFDLGTIIVSYIFCREFSDKRHAQLTAFLIAINVLHVSQAHLINVDTILTFFTVSTLLLFYMIFTRGERKWYMLSGIAVGLAASTKYNGAVLLAGLCVAHVLRARTIDEAIRSLKNTSLFAGIALSGAVFLILNPLVISHLGDFVLKFSQTELHMEYGHLGVDYTKSTAMYYLLESLPLNLGWPLLIIVLVSTGTLLLSQQKKNYLLLAIPVVFLVVLGSWQMRADRYIIPLIPFMIIIGSLGVTQLLDYLKKYRPSIFEKPWIGVAMVLIISFPVLLGVVDYQRTISLPDTRTLAKQWIEKNLQPAAAIAAGPFGIELEDTKFVKLPIQFSAVNSEMMAPFYDTRWYEDLDILVASDFDYGRYRQDPSRYHEMLSFYDSLRSGWRLSYELLPNEKQTGPTLWIYEFPKINADVPFDSALLNKLLSSSLTTDRQVNFLGKLGLILQLKGKLRRSHQVLGLLLTLDPENIQGKEAYARVSALINKQQQDIGHVSPSSQQLSKTIEQLEIRAQELLEQGKLDEAEVSYLKLLDLDKQNHTAYQGLMLVYGTRNDKEKVIEVLTQYLSILPRHSESYRLIQKQIEDLQNRQ